VGVAIAQSVTTYFTFTATLCECQPSVLVFIWSGWILLQLWSVKLLKYNVSGWQRTCLTIILLHFTIHGIFW